MAAYLLGLVGDRGAGKSTFASIMIRLLTAANKTVVYLKSSDVLNETLSLWGIENTTENLQKLGRAMRDAYGLDAIPNVVARRLNKAAGDVSIWDGIRWSGDEKLLRSLPQSVLVYVTAPPKIRYERLSGRAEKAEEQRGTPLTLQEFQTAEAQENERDIPVIGSRADYTINNISKAEALEGQIKDLLRDLRIF